MSLHKIILGRSAWFLIHVAATRVRTRIDLQAYERFVSSLIDIYPCTSCQTRVKEQFPAFLQELRACTCFPDDVMVWSYRLHKWVSSHQDVLSDSTKTWNTLCDRREILKSMRNVYEDTNQEGVCMR